MTQEKNQSQSNLQSNESHFSGVESLTEAGIADLHASLSKCLIVQRTYGKSVDDLPNILRVFIEALEGYPPHEILQAVAGWLVKSPDFPTPYDIICIIEEKTNGRDKPNSFVYNNLCRRHAKGDNLTPEQWDYINAYEAYYVS